MEKMASKPAGLNNVNFMGMPVYQLSRGEEYMSMPQRQHFANLLNSWREQLLQESSQTVHHLQDDIKHYADPLDQAAQEDNLSIELRTRDRIRKLIRKIEVTLEKIKENDYGYCEGCGAEIGVARLDARPTATQCIDCKTFAEIKERQTET